MCRFTEILTYDLIVSLAAATRFFDAEAYTLQCPVSYAAHAAAARAAADRAISAFCGATASVTADVNAVHE